MLGNEYHDLVDACGLSRQNIYGWEVTRGQTRVKLSDGTIGTITEWFGGHMILDRTVKAHRDDIVEVIAY